ncbi:hypothetical protein NKZ03_26010 [Sinorhizobium meliloti]|uniref:hypothetical protein n=1 Tax=Rhizobium meliloti TaxID=382 RepID=UPI003D653CDB
MKLLAISLMMVATAAAAAARAESLEECAAIPDDAQRVACYDRLAGRDPAKTVSPEAAACEAALVQRLVSPASYKRVDISEARTAMTIEQYVDMRLIEIRDRNLATPDLAIRERAALREEEARMKAGGGPPMPTFVLITITFDSQNRMGALIRGTETCGPQLLTR